MMIIVNAVSVVGWAMGGFSIGMCWKNKTPLSGMTTFLAVAGAMLACLIFIGNIVEIIQK